MVDMSASVNLPLHHNSRSSVLAPAHPGSPGKGAVKQLWWSYYTFVQQDCAIYVTCFDMSVVLSSLAGRRIFITLSKLL